MYTYWPWMPTAEKALSFLAASVHPVHHYFGRFEEPFEGARLLWLRDLGWR
jgi:hypothetical protein